MTQDCCGRCAAPAPAAGWIACDLSSDEPPVADDTPVYVRFRNGVTEETRQLQARQWSWGETGGGYTIVAYRLAAAPAPAEPPPSACKSKALRDLMATNPALTAEARAEIDAELASLDATPAPAEPARSTLPDGWIPLTLAFEPGYPEEIAYGPPVMMNRLKKWLDKHFATVTAAAPAEPAAQIGGRHVTVDAGALKMVLMALRRDAADGKTARGEMADALESTVNTAPAEPLNARLLEALKLTARLLEIESEQSACVQQRARADVAGDGRFGIAVKSDPAARRWQQLDKERCEILAEQRAAIADAEAQQVAPLTDEKGGDRG